MSVHHHHSNFKDAFRLIDHDKDGALSEPDLRHIFAALGLSPSNALLDALLSARPPHALSPPADRRIDFPMFLTMMTDRLSQFDHEPELTAAFECFDEADTGVVKVDELRKWMGEVGERMDHQEIDKLLNGPFTDRQGNFNYREWIKLLRVSDDGEPQ